MKEIKQLANDETDYHDKVDESVEDIDDTATDAADDSEYYPVPKGSTRLAALLSLILSVVALGIGIFLPYIGLALGIGAIILSIVSKRLVGYFDKLAVAGLIIGIFAIVFSAFTLIIVLTGVLDGLLIK